VNGGGNKVWRYHNKQQPFLPLDEIIEMENAIALLGAHFPFCEKPAEIAVCSAIRRIDENVRCAIGKNEAAADEEPRLRAIKFAKCFIGAHDPRKAVPIGDADRGKPKLRRLVHEFAWMRPAAQEREIGGDGEFGVAHAKSPWTYQRGRSVSRT
jgi:hypothetical protein